MILREDRRRFAELMRDHLDDWDGPPSLLSRALDWIAHNCSPAEVFGADLRTRHIAEADADAAQTKGDAR